MEVPISNIQIERKELDQFVEEIMEGSLGKVKNEIERGNLLKDYPGNTSKHLKEESSSQGGINAIIRSNFLNKIHKILINEIKQMRVRNMLNKYQYKQHMEDLETRFKQAKAMNDKSQPEIEEFLRKAIHPVSPEISEVNAKGQRIRKTTEQVKDNRGQVNKFKIQKKLTRNTNKNEHKSEQQIKLKLEQAKKKIEEQKAKKREEIILRMEKAKEISKTIRQDYKKNILQSKKYLDQPYIYEKMEKEYQENVVLPELKQKQEYLQAK